MGASAEKIRVLFLCTGNSCRSQMAEGWARHLRADVIEPYSAGIECHGMNPHAVRVMAEAGVDISGQRSKTVADLGDVRFDCVVTVCGHANEHCPVFPGKAKRLHAGFEDPPRLTKDMPDGETKLAVYRRVRDEIRAYVEALPGKLASPGYHGGRVGGPPACYGTMFPDLTRLRHGQISEGKAIVALVTGSGTGAQGRSLEVKRDEWDRCLTCLDYRTCYDLSLAKLVMGFALMNTTVADPWVASGD